MNSAAPLFQKQVQLSEPKVQIKVVLSSQNGHNHRCQTGVKAMFLMLA